MRLEPSTMEFIDALKAKAPKDVVKISLGQRVNEEAKVVSVHIPTTHKNLELYHLTDVQWGHKTCNGKKFIEYRDWILSRPNRFVVFGGDMIDAATMLSKGTPWENDGNPIEQVMQFVEVALPFRHRILGYVGGNHERHVRPSLGRDAGSLIASYLSIPYSSGQQLVDIHYGDWKPFTVALWHGKGAAQTEGAKAQMIVRYAKDQVNAQLCLVGHLHTPLVIPLWRQVRNYRGKAIGLQKYYACMSSSFLEFWGSYAECMGLTPADTMMARAIIEPNGKFEITLK